MPDTPSITLVKEFQYRGQPEEWSNKYHFSGDTPSDTAAWKALGLAIWNTEKTMIGPQSKLVAIYGYVAGNESSVAQINMYDESGGPIVATGPSGNAPGDVAFWVRWKTDQRNSKGRPIYLRKYFHGFSYTSPDTINTTTRTAALAYAEKMKDGTLPGGVKVCGPQGAVAGAAKVPTFTTTRTLKRRGADPS